jgi:hypothetical protein
VTKLEGKEIRHGRGLFIAFTGELYEGEWKDDKHCGFGRMIHPDGDVFTG